MYPLAAAHPICWLWIREQNTALSRPWVRPYAETYDTVYAFRYGLLMGDYMTDSVSTTVI